MAVRKSRDPSPVRAAMVHGCAGALTFFGTLAVGAACIHYTGDARAGSPVVRMALFDTGSDAAPTRFGADLNTPPLPSGTPRQRSLLRQSQHEEVLQPSLGVEYKAAQTHQAAPSLPGTKPAPQQIAAEAPQGVTINGRIVPYGKSYREIEAASVPSSELIQMNSLNLVDDAQAPQSQALIQGPFTEYANAFENPEGKPTVSIIVGGLGVNWGRTQAAISELPPQVTLAFAPTAQNLRSWVSKARRAGHEVLIELPMEPYDYGRLTPHPYVLQTAATETQNLQRLDKLLARTHGYLGVMNYQGGRFATDASAVAPIMAKLEAKGIGFFEDGRLTKSEFAQSAQELGMAFGQATTSIDARMEADEITRQLMLLEATALETGKSLGTGMSFPLTLDLVKEWIPTLQEKGILLAPASYYAEPNLPVAATVDLAALDTQG